MAKYICEECGEEFTSYNKNPKYCSILCKADSSAPFIDIGKLRDLYESGMTQVEVGEELGVSQKSIYKAMKRHGIKSRVAFKRDQRREKNDSWKGDEASYAAFHYRLYAEYGKPKKCSVCGTTAVKHHYDYANLTGRYEDMDDYAPMCRSCHWKFDDTILNIKHMRDKMQGGKKNAGE